MCTPNICAYTCRCVGACVHFSLWPRIFHMREDFILKRNKELFCSNSIHRKHFRKKKRKHEKYCMSVVTNAPLRKIKEKVPSMATKRSA